MSIEEVFFNHVGAPVSTYDLELLRHYVRLGFEEEILELIDRLAQKYPDVEAAEVAFITVWQGLSR